MRRERLVTAGGIRHPKKSGSAPSQIARTWCALTRLDVMISSLQLAYGLMLQFYPFVSVPTQFIDRRTAHERHRSLDLAQDGLEDVLDAFLTAEREPIDPWSTEHDCVRSECERFDDVRSASDARVEDDVDAAVAHDGVATDLGERVQALLSS